MTWRPTTDDEFTTGDLASSTEGGTHLASMIGENRVSAALIAARRWEEQ